MAIPQTSILTNITASKIGVVKVTGIDANLETRVKLGTTTEEYRWVVTITTETTMDAVTNVSISDTGNAYGDIKGTLRGATDLTLQLGDGFSGNRSSWRVSRESLHGINDDGSKQAVLAQTWLGVGSWQDAWWED